MIKMNLLKVGTHVVCGTVLVSVVRVYLISDLSTATPSAELATKFEAWIPINTDLSAIDNLQVEAIDSIFCLLSSSILDKAKSTGSLLNLVKTHDEVDNLTTL
jgi:hypothetical protein